MGTCLIMLANVMQRRFPQIFGKTFRYFITAFVVLSLMFFSSTWIIGTCVAGGSFRLGPPGNHTSESTLRFSNVTSVPFALALSKGEMVPYPVCSLDYNGLTVLDLALISDAAYGSTPEIQKNSMANMFDGTELQDWTLVNHGNQSEHHVWMELYFPRINTTVFAVRGTASAADALEDLHYWFWNFDHASNQHIYPIP